MHGANLRSVSCALSILLLGLALLPLAQGSQDETGSQLAQRLNASYAKAMDTCKQGQPAYYCSGVMLKQVAPEDPEPFWSHGEQAQQRGAERFDFLRVDISPGPLANPGYLFSDRTSAAAQGKDYELIGDDGMARPPQLLVRNWNHDQPQRLPLEALYYLRDQPGQLGLALGHQQAYHRATGQWLPILSLQPGAAQPFAFEPRAQLAWGEKLAFQLNARYERVLDACPGDASPVHCSGVLVRAVDPAPGEAVWMPDERDIALNGLSFSWIRRDINTRSLHKDGELGFIFDALAEADRYPVELRCAYPFNGFTSSLPDRCAATCASEGITTVQAWRDRYEGQLGSCTLLDNPGEIGLLLDIRKTNPASTINELIIAPWPEPMPANLPLAAFFYNIFANGRDSARSTQRDLMEQTGLFKPVIRLDLQTPGAQRFSYDPDDQVF